MSPEPELFAVRVARAPAAKRELFIVDETRPELIEIAFAFWVVRDETRVILIDTGFKQEMGVGWQITDYQSPIASLQQLGIAPGDVTDVVITHDHWDHVGELGQFPVATVWLTEATLLVLERPAGARMPELRDVLRRARREDRLRVLRSAEQVTSYLAVVPVGLHTEGFQYVVMARADGIWVISSDVGPLRASFEQLLPSGQTSDPVATRSLLVQIRDLVGGDLAKIVPGHEPGMFREKAIVELEPHGRGGH